MTATYKGNTIGLNYDAANATWSFTNEPNDFIDPNSFSTADPAFDYTPPASDDDDQDQDDDFNPCPPGYIYDSTLKQCVIDPNQQTSYRQDTGGGQDRPAVQIAGTNRTTTDNNFMASDAEYAAMSAGELIENFKQRGFVDKDEAGNLVVNLDAGKNILENLLGKDDWGDAGQMAADITGMGSKSGMSSGSVAKKKKMFNLLLDKGIIDQKLNQNLFNFYPGTVSTEDYYNNLWTRATGANAKIIIPTISKFEAEYQGINKPNVIVPGWGGSIFGTKASVTKFDDYMTNKLAAFKTVAMNKVKLAEFKEQKDRYEKAKERTKFSELKEQAEAEKARIQAERERLKFKEQAEQYEKAKEREQFKDQTTKYKQEKEKQKQQAKKEQFKEKQDRYEKAKEREKFQTQTKKYKAEKKKQTKQPTYSYKSTQSGPHGGGVMTKPSGPKKTSSYNPKKTGYQL